VTSPEPVSPFPRTVVPADPRQEQTLTTTIPTAKNWLCKAGRHHWIGVEDDNPEMRGQAHLECTRCGKVMDPPSYGPMPPSVLGPGVAGG